MAFDYTEIKNLTKFKIENTKLNFNVCITGTLIPKLKHRVPVTFTGYAQILCTPPEKDNQNEFAMSIAELDKKTLTEPQRVTVIKSDKKWLII